MKNLVLILLIGLIACTKRNESKLQASYNYLPVEESHWVDYLVDSIYIDEEAGVRDSDQYYIREQIGETFLDNESRSTQKLNRYKRRNLTDDWELIDVWHLNKLSQSVEKVEENLRFIKMIFPLTFNETWKGNNYVVKENDSEFYKDWEYRYLDIHEPLTIDSIDFDSTLVVDQQNLLTDHFWYYGREIYAYNIGMIKKELYNLTSEIALRSDLAWRMNAQRGFMITYTVVDYKGR